MTAKEILEYNILCAEFLGWKKTTEQFKINWVGCQTKERLERLNEEYIPILEKNGNVIFSDFSVIDFYSDWNRIMEVYTKINNSKITAPMNGIPDSIMPYIEKRRPIVKAIVDSKKESVIQAINQFLIWYNKNNK
jgi:hypothetical protein